MLEATDGMYCALSCHPSSSLKISTRFIPERRSPVRKLIEKLAKAEKNFVETRFLAPRIKGGQVRVKFEGLVNTYSPTPEDFEGWGVFQAEVQNKASLVKQADKVQVSKYLKQLNAVRLYLVRPLRGQSWLAYPVNGEEFRQRFGEKKAVAVHLVTLGRAFEPIIARFDGSNFWFDRIDRRFDPKLPTRLAKALKAFVAPEALKITGLTPELREAYGMVFQKSEGMRVRCSEARLRRALEQGGGQLESFVDRGDYWNTQWITSEGERHHSAIQKKDLTVLSAGICLDGEDTKFDLQSLVGVVEQRYE